MRIGVYFCQCGSNIAEKVDANEIEEKILQGEGDAYFKSFGFLCSEEGAKFLQEDVKTENPERVVIAACSPREHENTFMDALSRAGMNPYLMQMVNLREFVSWVTADKTIATQKAATYLKAALRRVKLHEPLEKQEISVHSDVLVIGAGPSGLKVALSLAESGRRVTLVEKTPAIGGLPVRFEDVFPDMECGPCMLEPMLSAVLHGEYSPNIETLTLTGVDDVVGYFGNFTAKLRQTPRYVDIEKCIGCMACLEACPVSGKDEFNCGLSERKAIAFSFLGSLPNAPYIDPCTCLRFKGEDCSLCETACKEICGESAVHYSDTERVIEKDVGAIITAVGASLYDCDKIGNLGYGKVSDVYNSLEFERITASNGTT